MVLLTDVLAYFMAKREACVDLPKKCMTRNVFPARLQLKGGENMGISLELGRQLDVDGCTEYAALP